MGRLLNGVLRLVMMALLSFAAISNAEVTLDGTLGAAGTLVGPNFQIPAEVGRQEGGNLFHSFGKFGVATQESATFTGPNSVDNVIGRVTGGETSKIDGLISNQIPDADLYLINPAGIMFGPNAQLDVQGSFHASTADFLRLGEQGRFDASQPENSVLTSAPPEAFGFVGDSPAPLSIDGSQLSVPEDKTLSIVGGGIDINNEATITASSGRINLASIGGIGDVMPMLGDLEVSASPGDLMIANLSTVDTSGEGGGDIYIRAGQLTLDQSIKSFTESGINGETLGAESGGVVDIEAEQFQLLNGSTISTTTRGTGRGGDIRIEVAEGLRITGESNVDFGGGVFLDVGGGIFASTANDTPDGGEAGNINIEAGRLLIADGGLISSSTFGGGDGNVIQINVRQDAILSGEDSGGRPSAIVSVSRSSGNAGKIILGANKLHLGDGTLISATTVGRGLGGDIKLNVTNLTEISGSESSSGFSRGIVTQTQGTGDAGNIELETRDLVIRDGLGSDQTGIFADALRGSSGNAGNITLKATGVLYIAGKNGGGFIASRSNEGAIGGSGTITLDADQIQLTDAAQIITNSFGSGEGGDIQIHVAKDVDISGVFPNNEVLTSGIYAETRGPRKGGNLKIDAQTIHIRDRGEISARSFMIEDGGDAGNIELHAEDTLRLENGFIQTSTEGADGGNIDISSPGILFLSDSEITTSVEDDIGQGGNISIIQPRLMVLGGSNIIANAVKGRGGNINIAVDRLVRDPASEITAESKLGVDGNVNVDSPDVNIVGGLSELPAKFSDATRFMPRPCAQRSGTDVIQFIFRNYDVLPTSPYSLRAHLPSALFLKQQDKEVSVEGGDNAQMTVLAPLVDC